MTKELLLARKTQLEAEIEHERAIMADCDRAILEAQQAKVRCQRLIDAKGGAMQDCVYWLNELEKPAAPAPRSRK